MPTEPQAHRTVLGGSTLDLRRRLDLGERVLLLVDATVNSVGVRRVSDGDIEVRNLRVLDLYEVPEHNDAVAELLDEARAIRREEEDARLGRMALPLDVEHWLVGFACGHSAHYPEDWLDREENETTPERAAYWRDTPRPEVAGGSAPCPVCHRAAELELGTVEEVTSVELAARVSEAYVDAAAAGDFTVTGDPALVEEWVGTHVSDYVDLDSDELLRRLDDLELGAGAWLALARFEAETFADEPRLDVIDFYADTLAVFAERPPWPTYDDDAPKVVRDRIGSHNAHHVELYEEAHRKRKSILGAVSDFLRPPPPIVNPNAVDDEETF